jgi:UDP-N-acetylmuramyl tripeptide synthase
MRSGDVLLVAGKGVEQSQIFGDIEIPYSDPRVVADVFGNTCTVKEF